MAHPTLDKLPRNQKFLLGDRIQTTPLDELERLIEATYSRARERSLREANLGIEKLRFLFRICVDLRYLDVRRYEHAGRAGVTGTAISFVGPGDGIKLGRIERLTAQKLDRQVIPGLEPTGPEPEARKSQHRGQLR